MAGNVSTAWVSLISRSSQAKAPTANEIAVICAHNQTDLLATFICQSHQAVLKDVHLHKFWQHLASNKLQPASLETILLDALQDLCDAVKAQMHQLTTLSEQLIAATPSCPPQTAIRLSSLPSQHLRSVSSILIASAPMSLTDLLRVYYSTKLHELSTAMEEGGDGLREGGEEDAGLLGSPDHMQEEGDENTDPVTPEYRAPPPSVVEAMGDAWAGKVRRAASCLRALGLGAASEETYTAVITAHVHARVSEMTRGVFDSEVLVRAQRYVARVPYEFLRLVVAPAGGWEGEAGVLLAVHTAGLLQEWTLRLRYLVYETVGALRIREMFAIVVDYPDSLPALHDVRECLRHTNLHAHFVAAFRDAVCARLLHAGAATADIIHQYVSTIRALRHVDPSGMLLAAVAEPIRGYLRSRGDTIRCIVSMLTDDPTEGAQSLLEERGVEGGGGGSAGDDGLDDPPSSGSPGEGLGGARKGDIASMLIGVYGGADTFITEYRSMLADRLLARGGWAAEREIRTLELLKLRFGEGSMHSCEVMLKDLSDSKRINASIRQQPPPLPQGLPPSTRDVLATTVVSYLFWPELQGAEVKLPPDVVTLMEMYSNRYHTIKTPRKLEWKTALGVVDVDVEVGGTVVAFQVSPVHAVMLLHFQAHPQLSASQLAVAVGVSSAVIRSKALFWVSQGVLQESRTPSGDIIYCRASHLDAPTTPGPVVAPNMGLEGEDQGGVSSAEEVLQAEMGPFENYITGVLTNWPAGLALERLHNMLRMFVVNPKYDRSLEQLSAFLQVMMGREKVVLENGIYKRKLG